MPYHLLRSLGKPLRLTSILTHARYGFLLLLFLSSLASPYGVQAQQEVSVDQFTGTAMVDLPLGSVSIPGVTVGVSLHYSGKGMQADDKGGEGGIGIGWGLSGIPIISREVRGLPDDFSFAGFTGQGSNPGNGTFAARYGWLTPATQAKVQSLTPSWPAFSYPLTVSANSCNTGSEPQGAAIVSTFETTPNNPATGTLYDSEPDIFSYAVPGHAGRFVFDKSGAARTMPFDPIVISYDNSFSDSLGTCIKSFTISTPEGNNYTFGVPDIVRKNSILQKWAPSNSNPQYLVDVRPSIFQRDFYNYRMPTAQAIAYAAAWHLSGIQNPAGERITFSYYLQSFWDAKLSYEPSAVRLNGFEPEYAWSVKRNNRVLREINSPTTFLRFNSADSITHVFDGGAPFTAIYSGYHSPQGGKISKTISFKYGVVYAADNMFSYSWNGQNQESIVVSDASSIFPVIPAIGRRFLQELSVSTKCGSPLSYKFRYRGVTSGAQNILQPYQTPIYTSIPPPGGAFHDYWGHLRFDVNEGWDQVLAENPRYYSYSGLSPQNVPSAPFRLFPYAGNTTRGGLDDQRPSDLAVPTEVDLLRATAATPAGATCFERSTLLGILEGVTLPTGGRIALEYEPHQFHDPVVESLQANSANYVGPGTRIKAISWTEPASGITQRREYRYTTSNGATSSGRLLWNPCIYFMRPFSTTGLGSFYNLTNHSFEDREIGYGRVTEVQAGKGSTVTTFALDGTASDISADPSGSTGSAPGSQLPVWHRSVVGPARLAGSCNSFATAYTPGYDTYPFPPSTNYDFWRGTRLSVVNFAEAVGTAAPVPVRSTTYSYIFRNLAPNAAPVVGWSYDGVSNSPVSATSPRAFAAARYELITDFQLALRQETTTLYDQASSSTGVTTSTGYAYNARGQVAGITHSNSDGSVNRTRYKYISDYNIPANVSTTDPNLRALAYRFYQEHLTNDLLETITEFVPAGTHSAIITSVSQATFRQSGTGTALKTRPYQALSWQATTAASASQNPADSSQVIGTAWRISPRFRAETTVEEVLDGLRQIPVTMSQRAGSTINSMHLGYGARLPTLQLRNAYASEARFSNFETSISPVDQTYNWQVSATGSMRTAAAARTGELGLHITAPATLSTTLPVPAVGVQLSPAAPGIRISFWVRAASAAQLTVQLARTTTQPATTVFTKPVAVAGMATWQLIEVPIPSLASLGVNPTNHGDFTVSVMNTTAGQTLDLDDILLLPSTAMANSITYHPAWGKTSETDAQGKTTYYDYSPSGRLRNIRNHQGDIVQKLEQVTNDVDADKSTVDFVIKSNNPASQVNDNIFYEGDILTLTTIGICEESNITYQWNFHCTYMTGGCTTALSSTSDIPTFTCPFFYINNSTTTYYTIELHLTTANGTQVVTKNINVMHAIPQLRYVTCVDGSRVLDACNRPLS